jgi:hypothetical protein
MQLALMTKVLDVVELAQRTVIEDELEGRVSQQGARWRARTDGHR